MPLFKLWKQASRGRRLNIIREKKADPIPAKAARDYLNDLIA